MSRSYAALWCKSNGSFLEGASFPGELVERAHELGLAGLAVTDRDGVYGIVPAHLKAQELGLPLLVGSQITLDDGSELMLVAQEHEGYRNLCRLITAGRLSRPKGESLVSMAQVCSHAEGLVALWGGACSSLVQADEDRFGRHAHALTRAFGDRLYGLVARHRLERETPGEARLRARAGRWRVPLVAAHEVLYHSAERQPLQDVMTCIRHGVTLASAGQLLRSNAEHALHPPADFAELFADVPGEVARTREVLERCRFSMTELRYTYPADKLVGGLTVHQQLAELTWAGAARRYPDGIDEETRHQVERELEIIQKLDYGGYFLTVYEIARFCRQQGILCQGRGSSANSAVCYCLEITAVDPVKMKLLFERFMSLERAEPPDIDLDIAHQRREEVIQYVYECYGRNHAAMVANLIRYRPRSALRDVGKALGMDALALEQLTRMLSHHDFKIPAEQLSQTGFDLSQPTHALLMRLATEILGFPRHLSIHPGGFLLGHEPVHDLVPIENGRMADRTVIQWDKNDIEALGLFKVDLLGLGALSHLDRVFKLIGEHRDVHLDMATLPADDPETYAMLHRAETIGIFQIESRAQMSMLPRTRPITYYDLVIQVSIVRPGPITGGMVHPYLRRRNGEESIEYPLEALRPILERTLGVPLFQEQVIKLAMVAADYSGGEADQLRRDMAAWKSSSKMEAHRERLIRSMVAKGIAEEFASRVFDQIRGFGEYGFPESHAASFALITYATSYLRRHYQPEFTCALLNSQPMGFYSPMTIIEDARRSGVRFEPLDVARSDWDCTMEQEAVRMGLRYVKGLDPRQGERLVECRRQRPFESLEDMAHRASLDRKAMTTLARAGALTSLGKSRRAQLWAIGSMTSTTRDCPWMNADETPSLPELDRADTIHWDCRHSSHSLVGHPMSNWRPRLQQLRLPDARTLKAYPHGAQVRYAGMVICRQRPETARGIAFFTLEDETGLVNVVVRPEIMESQAVLARTAGLLGVHGKLESRDGVIHLLARSLFSPEVSQQPVPRLASRDFH